MSCNCGKFLFSGSLDATQTVGEGFPISFTKNIALGCTSTDTSVTLSRAGLYQVVVTASGATTGTTAGNLVIELRNNGVQVANVQATATSNGTTDIVNMAFTAIVKVDPTVCPIDDNSATLTVVNTNGEAVYSDVTITIVRV